MVEQLSFDDYDDGDHWSYEDRMAAADGAELAAGLMKAGGFRTFGEFARAMAKTDDSGD